jgi:hypothetical protein
VVCCEKSDARAIGRKAARKEREGAAESAAMVGDVWCRWCVLRLVPVAALTFTISRSESLQLPSLRATDETSSFRYSLAGGRRHIGTPLA